MNTTTRRYVSIQDAATYLSVSAQTIRRMLAAGELTRYRAGRVIRIDLNQLDAIVGR